MTNEKAAELNGKIRTLVQQLASETDAARQSELFTQYLKTCGLFHSYSWHNCMLIFAHRPNATRVAGYETWRKLGRQVRKGEKGIPIFAPMIFRDKQKDSDGQESSHIWFKVVYVFDLEQTDGESLPELPSECLGDGAELAAELQRFAESKGIAVTYQPITGSAKGYAHEKGSAIVIDETLASADKAAVLIHEISHCLLHFGENKPDLKLRELQAEATAYVVASHFGLAPESGFYLASYDVTAADLLASLETIQQTAQRIIDGCVTSATSRSTLPAAA